MAFQNHKELLQQNFTLNVIPQPKPKEVVDQIENTFKAFDQFKIIKENKEPTPKPVPKNSKKKPILITDEQAEDFLLRTVFNVNIQHIDIKHNNLN